MPSTKRNMDFVSTASVADNLYLSQQLSSLTLIWCTIMCLFEFLKRLLGPCTSLPQAIHLLISTFKEEMRNCKPQVSYFIFST